MSTESFSSNTSPLPNFVPEAGSTLNEEESYVGIDETIIIEQGGKAADSNIAPVQPIGGTGSMTSGRNVQSHTSDPGSAYEQIAGDNPGDFDILDGDSNFSAEYGVAFTPSGVLSSEMVDLEGGANIDSDKTVSQTQKGNMPSVVSSPETSQIIVERDLNKSTDDSEYDGVGVINEDWRSSLAPEMRLSGFASESVGYLSDISPTGVLANEILGMMDGGDVYKTTDSNIKGAMPVGASLPSQTIVERYLSKQTSARVFVPGRGSELPILDSITIEDYIKVSKFRDNMYRDTGIIKISDLIAAVNMSAYQTWLSLGNEGTEQDFIDSLQGEPGPLVDHNDLPAIQGGTTNERYHLTQAELTKLNNQSGTNTGDQDLSPLLLKDQTTPQSTVGIFTFPEIKVTGNLAVDTNVLFVDSTSNKVGLGTSAPDNKLTVQETGNLAAAALYASNTSVDLLKIQSTNASGYSSIGFFNDSSTKVGGFGYANAAGGTLGQRIYFYGVTKDLVFSTDNGTTVNLTIKNTTGNIGVNQIDPGYQFEVYKAATGLGGQIVTHNPTEAVGNYTGLGFALGNVKDTYQKGGIYYNSIAGQFGRGDIQFVQNSIANSSNANLSHTVMTLTNSGNLGIGTTTPAQKLHVEGIIRSGSDAVNGEIRSNQAASGGDFYIALKTSSGKSGLFRSNTDFFNYYDTSTGDTVFDATYTGSKLIFKIQGTEKVRIDNSGNLGIGTTAPSEKLDIQVTSGNPNIRLTSQQNGTASSSIIYRSSTTPVERGRFVFSTNPASPYPADLTWQVERTGTQKLFFIDGSSGNVGIRTTGPLTPLHTVYPYSRTDTTDRSVFTLSSNDASPSTLANKLTISSIGHATDQVNRKWNFQTSISSTNAGSLNLQPYGGNVGVGTTSPNQKLQIVGASNAGNLSLIASTLGYSANAGQSIYFGQTAGGLNYFDEARISGFTKTGGGGVLAFYTNASEKLRIDSNGNVGIGTSTPSTALHVNGAGTFNGSTVRIDVNGSNPMLLGYGAGGDAYAGIWLGQSSPSFSNYAFLCGAGDSYFNAPLNGRLQFRVSNATYMVVDANGVSIPGVGNVSNPTTQQLTIIPSSTTKKGIVVEGLVSQTANLQEWQDSAGTALSVVNASGNFGIGTTAPGYQLQVQGTGLATDGILITTSAYTSVPNPGSVSNKIILNPRGFGMSVDGATLSAGFQPGLGIGLAANRNTPALALKNGPTYTALAIESGYLTIGKATGNKPIDVKGTIRSTSDAGSIYETLVDIVATEYQGLNYSSGGLEVNGVKAAVGYGMIGSMKYYGGAGTDATSGWAFKSNGSLGTSTLALSSAQMVMNYSGNVGIGTTAPSSKLHIIGTTEQFRAGYDVSNYYSTTVGSTGTVTFNAVGSESKFVFSDNIELTQTVTTEAVTSDTTVTIVINGTTYKLLAKA